MSKKKNKIDGDSFYRNGKKHKPREMEDFLDTEASSVNLKLLGLHKEMDSISLSQINIKGSKKFQGRTQGQDISSLLDSINKNGINDPLKGIYNEESKEYFLLDGFTRYKVYEILSDEKLVEKYGVELTRKFSMKDKVSIVIYENKDKTILSEAQIKDLATLFNNQRKNWGIIDVIKSFVAELKHLIKEKAKEVIEADPNSEVEINLACSSNFPRMILSYLEKLPEWDVDEVGLIRNQAIQKIMDLTGKTKNEIMKFSKLIEIPENYWAVFTKNGNKWGLEITEKQALDIFFNSKGFVKKTDDIELFLNNLQEKENKSGKGVKKVSSKAIKEEKENFDNKEEEQVEIKTPKKLSKKERINAKMMLDHVKREDKEAKKKTITFIDFVDILEKWDNLKSIDQLKKIIKKKFGLELPEIESA